MKEKLYKAGFQVRLQGADAAWARVTREIDMFKQIIDQGPGYRNYRQCRSGILRPHRP